MSKLTEYRIKALKLIRADLRPHGVISKAGLASMSDEGLIEFGFDKQWYITEAGRAALAEAEREA